MRIVMMGTGMFAEPTFERLLASGEDVVGLVTQPDRDAGNKRGSTRQAGKGMKTIAAERSVPVIQPESINTPDGVAALRDLRPELMVVAAYGQILSKDVLSVPTVGTINVHASLLPKYRGAAPVAYAILNGETRTGVTIIKVTPGLDSGDMILQEAIDILPDDTTGSLEARLADVGAKLAVEAVQLYKSGPVNGEKQDPALVTKAPKIKKEHGLIDWSKPAEVIANHVRAMQPWPTAYTFLHTTASAPIRLIAPKARIAPVPDSVEHAQPGHVIEVTGASNRIHILAGDWNLVELLEVQPAGKRKMTAEEFLRGHRVQLFDRFGPEVLS